MKKRYWIPLVLLVIWGTTGIYQIRPEERAVVRRFGKVVAHPGPGLWVALPWGIDRVERVSTTMVRRVVVGYQAEVDDLSSLPGGQLLTGDQNLVDIQLNIDYTLGAEDSSLDDFVMQRDRLDVIVTREAETVLAEWAAGRDVDEVLLQGNSELPRWMLPRLQARLEPLRLGIRIQQAGVAYLSPPDKVRSKFDDVNRAKAEIRTQEFRAHQDAEQRLQESRAEVLRLERLAQDFASLERGRAQADADAFRALMVEKQRNPHLVSAIWWKEVSELLRGMERRGRVRPLDEYLGPDGVDVTEFVPLEKRR